MTHRITAILTSFALFILLLTGCTSSVLQPAASITSPASLVNGNAMFAPAVSPWETPRSTSNVQNQISNHIPYRDGEPMFSDALKAALNDPAKDNTIFNVWICFNYDIGKISGLNYAKYVYEGLTIPQWHDEYIPTIRSLDKYKRELHSKLKNVEPFDKWSGLNEENIKLEAEWDAAYEDLWREEHPGKLYPIAAYNKAREMFDEAIKSADETFISNEIARLKTMGITLSIVPNERIYAAALTKEQVLALPVNDNIKGYTMVLAHESKITFDGRDIMYIDEDHI